MQGKITNLINGLDVLDEEHLRIREILKVLAKGNKCMLLDCLFKSIQRCEHTLSNLGEETEKFSRNLKQKNKQMPIKDEKAITLH